MIDNIEDLKQLATKIESKETLGILIEDMYKKLLSCIKRYNDLYEEQPIISNSVVSVYDNNEYNRIDVNVRHI